MKTNTCLRASIGFAIAIFTCAAAHAAWKVDPDFRPLPSFGYALPTLTALQPDGKVIVGGGSQRLNADGSVDSTWQPSATDFAAIWVSPAGQLVGVRAVPNSSNSQLVWLTSSGATTPTQVSVSAPWGGIPGLGGFQADGKLVIFGNLTAVNSVFRAGIARINANGTLDDTFDAGSGPSPGLVQCVSLQPNGKMFVGGWFDSFSGVARNQLVRLNESGTVDPSFNSGPVVNPPGVLFWGPSAVAVDALGRVYRADRTELRRYDADGTNPVLLATATTSPNMTADIAALHVGANGKLLLAGSFTAMNGEARTLLAQLNADGSTDESFDASLATSGMLAYGIEHLLVDNSRIYIQSGAGTAVALLANGRINAAFQPGVTAGRADVFSVAATSNGSTVIGGHFTHVDDIMRPGVAQLMADGSLDASFDPNLGVTGEVRAVAIQSDGKIVVGGSFIAVGGITRRAVARLNANGTVDTSFNAAMGPGSVVRAIAVQSNDAIAIGGTFSTVGGATCANLARLLPDGSIDPSFGVTSGVTGTNAEVRTIESLAGDLLMVAGVFDAWNGTRRWNVMRLNADGSLDAAFNPNLATAGAQLRSASVAADGSVAIAGSGGTLGTAAAAASLDSTGALRFSRPFTDNVTVPAVLADQSGSLVVSVDRDPYETDAFNTLERFAIGGANGTPDYSFVPEFATGTVRAFARGNNGSVLVAGNFVETDAMAYASVLRLLPDTPPPHLANISTRGYVGTNDEILVAGFFVGGNEPQRVLIRGIAANLAQFGVSNLARTPGISVFRAGQNTAFATNFLWDFYSPRLPRFFNRLGAFPLALRSVPIGQTTSDDCALLLDLPPGGYTVQMRAQAPGIGLIEVYDANGIGADRKLINISTRGRVGIGDERMIVGFVVDRGTKSVLIRAVGPGIASLIAGTLANPTIDLVRQSDQVTIASNDNWGDNANAAEIATVTPQVSGLLLASGSADAALLVDLPTGAYTVVTSGVGNTTGIALVEVYEIPTQP